MTGVDITLMQGSKTSECNLTVPLCHFMVLGAHKLISIKGFAIGVGNDALKEAHENSIKLMKAWQQQSK